MCSEMVRVEDYRVILARGCVWLVREDGSLVGMSSWQECCLSHVERALKDLAEQAARDFSERSEA